MKITPLSLLLIEINGEKEIAAFDKFLAEKNISTVQTITDVRNAKMSAYLESDQMENLQEFQKIYEEMNRPKFKETLNIVGKKIKKFFKDALSSKEVKVVTEKSEMENA